eukprot:1825439-Alexandrium_andersonii.AAC.1
MSASLVGSEMCIRDRGRSGCSQEVPRGFRGGSEGVARGFRGGCEGVPICLLYTSDAADDM